jgi:hypothetical protein
MLDIREGRCPHCRHDEIIQSAPVTWAGAPHPLLASAAINSAQPQGALNLFICRRCGFAQLFAFEPHAIPVGTQFGTRLVKGSADSGPYR